MSITPHADLIEKIDAIGQGKTAMSLKRLAVLSVMAGAFIALGGILSVIAGFGMAGAMESNPAIQRLLSGLTFPVGLFLIVTFGAELFTGNNATLVPGCARRRYTPGKMVVHWTLVWLFNFAGALVFTYLFVYLCGLTAAEPYHSAVVGIAEAKASLPPLTAFLKGIAANWCVCLAVWLCLMVDTLPSKFLACLIPVGTFVALGFEHSIANMFFIPAGMMEGANVDFWGLMHNLIPVTLGNIVGGALLVGALFYRLHARSAK